MTHHVEEAVLEREEALGGAPLMQLTSPADEHQAARKRRKREAKLRRDAERPPDSFERFKVLAELVKEGRQIIDLVDHRARYALVVIGVLNTGVFLVLSRGHLFAGGPSSARVWMIAGLLAYAAVTVLFVYYAVDCLRPRRMHYGHLMNANARIGEADAHSGPRGVLYWETIAKYDLDGYRRAWSAVRMEQLNAEVVVIAHEQARLIREKYIVLGRLYTGLAAAVVLAGMLLGVFALFGS
jgi:hypothetical protein